MHAISMRWVTAGPMTQGAVSSRGLNLQMVPDVAVPSRACSCTACTDGALVQYFIGPISWQALAAQMKFKLSGRTISTRRVCQMMPCRCRACSCGACTKAPWSRRHVVEALVSALQAELQFCVFGYCFQGS